MRAFAAGMTLLVAIGATTSCSNDRPLLPPEGQILLYVTTDAVLPAPPGEPQIVPGIFDRLSIEIFPPGENVPCVGCARQFAIDAPTVDQGRASMGYVPVPGTSGTRARVRLFRTRGSEIIEPRPTSTLETVVAFPVVASEGIVEITAVLETSSLGSPVGTLDAPAEPRPGKPPRGFVGSWEAARRRPCAGAPLPGEVCIPGGAFWIGQPSVSLPFPDQKRALDHLVALSPFFIDATEVTVEQLRASGVADPFLGPGQKRADPLCNYSEKPGDLENHPVNCISREMSQEHCAKRGARLQTEAEYEYVATALGRNERYPWGEDRPRCGDAIYARAHTVTASTTSKACGPQAGTAPVGTAARDRVTIPGGGDVFDLAGNVTEWVADEYNDEYEPCWTAPILLDPMCKDKVAPSPRFTTRGAHYSLAEQVIDVKIRFQGDPKTNVRPYGAGVRCVRPSE